MNPGDRSMLRIDSRSHRVRSKRRELGGRLKGSLGSMAPSTTVAKNHIGTGSFRFGGGLSAKTKDQMERRFEILAACAFGGSVTAPLANAATGIVTEVSTSRAISRTGNPSASRTKRSSRVASL